MKLRIESLGDTEEHDLVIRRLINLGSATRESDRATAHQDEVAKEGVRISFDTPAPRIYPVGTWILTTENGIGVQGARTSGEVEIVLIQGDELLVTVGSDHTDRDLERISILWSKQACPNVMAPYAWKWSEVADHWDSLILECDLDGKAYQRVGVDAFLHPTDLLRIVHERAELPEHGLVVFCGTYVSLSGTLEFGTQWTFRLIDPVAERAISHQYRVDQLLDDIHPDFRVPLTAE